MEPPVSASLVAERKAKSAFHRRVFLGIEALVDHDALVVKENRAENVGTLAPVKAGARNAEQPMGVVELNAELEVLLNNVLDGNGRFDNEATRLRKFGSIATASRSIASSAK